MSVMSAKNLRDSILQMAVEGKLVEQRAEEGSAADLLASIREQRAQLVRAKKAKPVKGGESVIWRDDAGHWFERRGKGEAVCIDEEIPFDIPDSWCWARLSSVSSVVTDGDHQAPPQVKEGVPFLVISDISDGSLSFNNTRFVPKSYYDGLDDSRKPMIGDVLLTVTGSFGIPVVVDTDVSFCFQRHIALIRAILSYSYLKEVLDSGYASRYFIDHATGTAQKTVSLSALRDFLVPIASLAEQNRIVEKIDELMPHVDEYSKAQEQREQLDRGLPVKVRKSILQAAVEGKLTEQSDDDEPASVLLARIREQRAQLVREKKAKPVKGGESVIYRDDAGHWFERRGKSDPVCIDEEIPFDIPDTWCWVRLTSLGEIVGGGTPKTGVREYWSNTDAGIPWITPADMKSEGSRRIYGGLRNISGEGLNHSSARLLPEGSVLMSSRAPIGYLAIAGRDLATNQGFKSLVLLNMHMNKWVLLALESFMPSIQKRASGTTFKEISGTEFGKTIIPIPPLAEQDRLIEKMCSLLDETEALR